MLLRCNHYHWWEERATAHAARNACHLAWVDQNIVTDRKAAYYGRALGDFVHSPPPPLKQSGGHITSFVHEGIGLTRI